MVTGAARRGRRQAGYAGRRAANSTYTRALARAGFTARGAMYILIGVIALLVAFGQSGHQANQTGALRLIGRNPAGEVALWLLAVGLAGMVLWRASDAVYGGAGSSGRKAGHRIAAGAKAVLYGFLCYGVLKYALGIGAPSSSNKQAVDLTASAMQHPGGTALVIIVGLAVTAAGIFLIYRAARRKFLSDLNTGQMSSRTRRAVEFLGLVGGIARGVVFGTAGVFLVVAAAQSSPGKAKGIDSALRTLTRTPLGPWLLAAVAAGLVMFGLYSCCEARWRKV
jgi:Domain of Unknown Function (DUF1206)